MYVWPTTWISQPGTEQTVREHELFWLNQADNLVLISSEYPSSQVAIQKNHVNYVGFLSQHPTWWLRMSPSIPCTLICVCVYYMCTHMDLSYKVD